MKVPPDKFTSGASDWQASKGLAWNNGSGSDPWSENWAEKAAEYP